MTSPSRAPLHLTRALSNESAGERDESRPVYCTTVEVPARQKSTDVSESLNGRRWKSFLNKGRGFDGSQSVAKIQETSRGTFVSVMRDERHRRDGADGVRPAHSAESLGGKVPAAAELRHPGRDAQRQADRPRETNEITAPVHQPVTISFVHKPVRERTHSGGTHIRRHPVLTSFKRVSSEHTVFYTKVEYHPVSSSQRRASTGGGGGGELENAASRQGVSSSPEYRPLSVYENRPLSVYDNEPTTFRYSSPVFSKNYNSIPEENYRYSTPANLTPPPMQRKLKGRLSDHQIAITGARLAQASLVPCTDSNRPTQ